VSQPPVDVPHHFQETDHTCGPAALKMVLESLWGTVLDEDELAELLATDHPNGTGQRAIEVLLSRSGLAVRSFDTETTLDELRPLLAQGHVIIVLYYLEVQSTDHYAVVTAIDDQHVVLSDPLLGPDIRLPRAEFESSWESRENIPGRRDRWALAVRNRGVSPV